MSETVVYAAQAGDLVKIGFTGSLRQRLDALGWEAGTPVDLLGVCPGGRELEAKWLKEFASSCAHGREWFWLTASQLTELRTRLSAPTDPWPQATYPVTIPWPKDALRTAYEVEAERTHSTVHQVIREALWAHKPDLGAK